jgi:hypothetical protein
MSAARTCIAGCLAAVTLAACSREPNVVTYRVAKQRPVAAAPSRGAAVTWDLPEGWEATQGSSMRLASFSVPTGGQPGDCSLVLLGGTAGGLAANVNRWRGQVGLPHVTAEAIEDQARKMACRTGEFLYVKILGDAGGQSILASILEGRNEVLFAKLTVSTAEVEGVEASFLDFCKSLSMPSQGNEGP